MASSRSGALVEHRRQLIDELRPALRREDLQRAAAVVGGAVVFRRPSPDSAGRPRCRRIAARLRRRAARCGCRRALQPVETAAQSDGVVRSTRPSRPSRIPSSRLDIVFGALPIAATSGSSASASTARRAMNRASSGMLLCDGALERECGILLDERLHAEPEHLRQVVIRGVFAVRHQRAARSASAA